jgi:hypothetical protein
MRTLFIVLVIALSMIPVITQAIEVGGDYGKTWIADNGGNNAIPQTTGLWDWGLIPKGQMLVNGKLQLAGPGFLINPTEGATPIILNEATLQSMAASLNASQLSNNNTMVNDPWYIAASTEQPVLLRTLPY